jgi:ankyrin repeat protein
VQDENGMTALMNAAACGYSEIAQSLIAAGDSLEMQDRDGMTALMNAAACN